MLSAGSLAAPKRSQGRRHHPARAAGCTGMVLGGFLIGLEYFDVFKPSPKADIGRMHRDVR
jgi:hypothetical protein